MVAAVGLPDEKIPRRGVKKDSQGRRTDFKLFFVTCVMLFISVPTPFFIVIFLFLFPVARWRSGLTNGRAGTT